MIQLISGFSMVHRLSRINSLNNVYNLLVDPQPSYTFRNHPLGGVLPWLVSDIGPTVGLMGRNLQIGEWYRDYPDVPCMISALIEYDVNPTVHSHNILIIRGWRETTTYDYDPAISVILTVSKTRNFRPEDLLYPPTEIPLPIPPVGVRTAKEVLAIEEIVVFNESIDELDDLYIKTTTTYESGEVFADFVDVISRRLGDIL